MTIVLTLVNGETFHLDRQLRLHSVAEVINENRGGNALIPFADNNTPSRTIFIDPDRVASIRDDGHSY